MKFEKKKKYWLSYTKTVPSRRYRGTNSISDYHTIKYSGEYEYIGSRGGKLHFYDNNAGIDILFTKKEALEALEAFKNHSKNQQP